MWQESTGQNKQSSVSHKTQVMLKCIFTVFNAAPILVMLYALVYLHIFILPVAPSYVGRLFVHICNMYTLQNFLIFFILNPSVCWHSFIHLLIAVVTSFIPLFYAHIYLFAHSSTFLFPHTRWQISLIISNIHSSVHTYKDAKKRVFYIQTLSFR